jgi:hypothetical protein
MNRKRQRSQNKLLRRRDAKKAFITPLPKPVLLATVAEVTPPQLSPKDEMLWQEIRFITTQVRELLQRASAKIAARALLEGLREAGTTSSVG